jgi:hypothetical protein
MRIDFGSPLAQGNMILFHGDKQASGSHSVMLGAVLNFVNESASNLVVYAGLTKSRAS